MTDPFTAASPTYRAAMRDAVRHSDALEIYSPGQLLSTFGKGIVALVTIGLVVALIVLVMP